MSLLYIMLYVIIVFLSSYILPPIYGKINFIAHLLANTFRATSNSARLRGDNDILDQISHIVGHVNQLYRFVGHLDQLYKYSKIKRNFQKVKDLFITSWSIFGNFWSILSKMLP